MSLKTDGQNDHTPEGVLTLTRRQAGAVVTGTAFVVVGLAVLLTPVEIDIAPELLNIVGIITLFSCLYFATLLVLMDTRTVTSPAVERRIGLEPAGEDFETSIQRRDVTDESLVAAIESNVRTELSVLARELLQRQDSEGGDVSTQLADGTWTADDVAADFVEQTASPGQSLAAETGRTTVHQQGPPPDSSGLLSRALTRLRETPLRPSVVPFKSRVERSVVALASTTGVDTGPNVEWAFTDDQRPDSWEEGVSTTSQWQGLTGLAVVTLGIGVLLQVSGLVLVAGLLLGAVGYSRLTKPPALSLAVERTVDTTDPAPGDAVTVRVSVTNTGDSILPDLRLVDGVPDRLAVDDGTPRHATALRPGESVTFEYDVLAVYGDHEFNSIHAAVRGSSGHHERRETLETDSSTLVCEPGVVVEDVPLHPASSNITGRVRSETGGAGQEFRSVREYRRGDPLKRVDWNRLARTGNLASLQFTEEQAGTIILLVDARPPAFTSPSLSALSALDRSVAGASQLFTTLDEDGDRIGLASISSELLWIEPGGGPEHRSMIRDALKHAPVFEKGQDGHSVDGREYARTLRRRLPNDAQLIVFSPLLDDTVVESIRYLRAYGFDTTVFSPNPTNTDNVGSIVARLRRDVRLDDLKRAGVPLIDWQPAEKLDVAVARATGWRL